MDVTNPGLVNVANEVSENPDPNGGSVLLTPEQLDVLTDVGSQGYPPAGNGVSSSVFPTPGDVIVTGTPVVPVTQYATVPLYSQVIVDDQVLGQGVWVPVDPNQPNGFKRFVPPAEFIVVGPAESIQTNNSETTTVLCTISAVYDADKLWSAPSATTTRYLLVVDPPALTSYPVSMLGRQIVFADDTSTSDDQGAVRFITGYNTNYIVIDKDDTNDGNVSSLTAPSAGDTFLLDVQRQGSEQVNLPTGIPVDVIVFPSPQTFVANASQDLSSQGGFNGGYNISTGAQPGQPIITSGTQVPSSINVEVINQTPFVGLPVNVFV
jgi:hypothetical protein